MPAQEAHMDVLERYEQIFGIERTADFEERVTAAAERAIAEFDKLVADEVKLRYITQVYARSLDHIAEHLEAHQHPAN